MKADPLKRRGFHLQEIIDLAIDFHVALVTIERYPMLCDGESTIEGIKIRTESQEVYFETNLHRFDGILLGKGAHTGHATAWCHQTKKILDPNGQVYDFDDTIFQVDMFLAAIPF